MGSGSSMGVFANVPETAGYSLAYCRQIGINNSYTTAAPYSINNSASDSHGLVQPDRILHGVADRGGLAAMDLCFVRREDL